MVVSDDTNDDLMFLTEILPANHSHTVNALFGDSAVFGDMEFNTCHKIVRCHQIET